jgi:hypothetical protein
MGGPAYDFLFHSRQLFLGYVLKVTPYISDVKPLNYIARKTEDYLIKQWRYCIQYHQYLSPEVYQEYIKLRYIKRLLNPV